MNGSTFLWQAAGFGFATLAGTLLHFLYDWTGGSILVAPFSGVNESTWEHMKLLYWPLLFFATFQSFCYREQKSFWWIKLLGTLTGLLLIPVLFYTYNGVFGKSTDWVNIAIFYVATAATFLLEWRLLKREAPTYKWPQLPSAVIFLIGILFAFFTFFPPHIPLFQDPVTGNFGR